MIETPFPTFDELESIRDDITNHNEAHGDILAEIPSENTTRIYVQNLNGLNWDQHGGKWQYICEVMEGLQVDIACFSETNTDTNRYSIRKTMERICQLHFPHNHLIMATSKYETSTTYKPGGTAILACNSVTSNIKSHTRDRMGRWTSISFATASARRIRIISAYQVCQTIKQGTNTAASQQQAQLIEDDDATDRGRRRTLRQAFIFDLQAFILQIQRANQ